MIAVFDQKIHTEFHKRLWENGVRPVSWLTETIAGSSAVETAVTGRLKLVYANSKNGQRAEGAPANSSTA